MARCKISLLSVGLAVSIACIPTGCTTGAGTIMDDLLSYGELRRSVEKETPRSGQDYAKEELLSHLEMWERGPGGRRERLYPLLRTCRTMGDIPLVVVEWGGGFSSTYYALVITQRGKILASYESLTEDPSPLQVSGELSPRALDEFRLIARSDKLQSYVEDESTSDGTSYFVTVWRDSRRTTYCGFELPLWHLVSVEGVLQLDHWHESWTRQEFEAVKDLTWLTRTALWLGWVEGALPPPFADIPESYSEETRILLLRPSVKTTDRLE